MPPTMVITLHPIKIQENISFVTEATSTYFGLLKYFPCSDRFLAHSFFDSKSTLLLVSDTVTQVYFKYRWSAKNIVWAIWLFYRLKLASHHIRIQYRLYCYNYNGSTFFSNKGDNYVNLYIKREIIYKTTKISYAWVNQTFKLPDKILYLAFLELNWNDLNILFE